jgi:hypothetical protein
VKGPRTILLVAAAQTTLTAFQRRNTRFPANFIADRAAEAHSSPRRFRLMHDGGVSKSVPIL